MNTYCVKCKRDTGNLNSKIFRTKDHRLIMQSKCRVCGIKKSSKSLLSNLGIRTPLSKILLNNLF